MLNLRKIKPLGCQVLVTEDVYGWDDENEAGIIVHKKGDLKSYQTVLAVGDDVNFVKEGDVVELNLYKYAIMKEDPNSIKAGADNPIIGLRLNEVELIDEEGLVVPCFLIDQRDVKYIIEDYEEVKYNKKDELVRVPKKQLILPSRRIKV